MTDDENKVVELIDENNHLVKFEHIMTVEHNDKDYVILTPLDMIEGVNEDEVIILKVEQDVHGDDLYVGVEDENELEEVYDLYMEICNQDDLDETVDEE